MSFLELLKVCSQLGSHRGYRQGVKSLETEGPIHRLPSSIGKKLLFPYGLPTVSENFSIDFRER
jgi:hypothetical protein